MQGKIRSETVYLELEERESVPNSPRGRAAGLARDYLPI